MRLSEVTEFFNFTQLESIWSGIQTLGQLNCDAVNIYDTLPLRKHKPLSAEVLSLNSVVQRGFISVWY